MAKTSNDCVLIAQNPVAWRTYARRVFKKEPKTCEADGIRPYYQEGSDNSTFSTCEIEALNKLVGIDVGTMLSRYELADGKVQYIPVRDDFVEKLSPSMKDQDSVRNVVFNFLVYLGGKNLSFDLVASQHAAIKTTRRVEGEAGKGENSISGSMDAEKSTRSDESWKVKSSLDYAEPDYVAAKSYMDEHPWLRERFGVILSQAEKGKLSGAMKIEFKHESLIESVNKAQATLEIAVKYKLINAKIKKKFERESKDILSRSTEWVVNVEFERRSPESN